VSKLDGYFINLDRSEDRRISMNERLAAVGLENVIKRFPAIDGWVDGPFDNRGENGVWACRRSHEQAILQSDENAATVVLEDDAELSHYLPHVINEGAIAGIIHNYPELDMFFLDCSPFFDQIPLLLRAADENMKRRSGIDAGQNRHEVTGVAFPDARSVYAYCATGYVVLPQGKRTLRRLFNSGVDSRYPVDIMYRDWISQGELKANLTVPFLATADYMSDSTIHYRSLDQNQLLGVDENRLASAVRRLLFGGDPKIDVAMIEKLLSESSASPEFRLGMKIYDSLHKNR
jgi:GR25 family glycosyltransferase involved in LPS biosynthesis